MAYMNYVDPDVQYPRKTMSNVQESPEDTVQVPSGASDMQLI